MSQIAQNDVQKMSDEDLENILRRAENSHVPGSLYNQAKNEAEIRYRKKTENSNNKEWHEKFSGQVITQVIVGVIIVIVSSILISLFQ